MLMLIWNNISRRHAQSVLTGKSCTMAVIGGILDSTVALAALLGFVSSMTPAWKSAAMDPQAAVIQGEVN